MLEFKFVWLYNSILYVTPRIFAVEFFLFFTRQIRALPFLFLFALAKP
jgi:hypothetical protein